MRSPETTERDERNRGDQESRDIAKKQQIMRQLLFGAGSREKAQGGQQSECRGDAYQRSVSARTVGTRPRDWLVAEVVEIVRRIAQITVGEIFHIFCGIRRCMSMDVERWEVIAEVMCARRAASGPREAAGPGLSVYFL